MIHRICAVIPSYNHHRALPAIVERLRGFELDIFIVDDGNDEPIASAIAALNAPDNGVVVARLPSNQGKGAAVHRGLLLAQQAGYTHAIQIDADGQHDLAAVPRFLSLSREAPEAVVNGRPVYDETIPLSRRLGRWITHFWVWVECLSFAIRDAMCGFRVYPIEPALAVLDGEHVGRRMDFDVEIIVRMFWRGVPIIEEPLAVTYPDGNLSNFDAVMDNWRISCMHTRLFFGMLRRLPRLLSAGNRRQDVRHWSVLAERGLYSALWLSALLVRVLGRRGCMTVLSVVALYFYVTGREQRRASLNYLRRMHAVHGLVHAPGWWDGYRVFLSFAGRCVDSFAAWTGSLPGDIIAHSPQSRIDEIAGDPRGALFIVSHLGNAEISRALLGEPSQKRLTILVHTAHAENYNRILSQFNPSVGTNTLQVSEMGPDTIIALRDRIERGEWVVIAGDRTPVSDDGHVTRVPFLGADASFANGPVILGSLLGCPIYTLFCLKEDGRYTVYFEHFAERIVLPRKDRPAAIRAHVARYAQVLERYAVRATYQWYNFFDFWA